MPTYVVKPSDLPKQLADYSAKTFQNLVEAIRVSVKKNGPRIVQQIISSENPQPVDRGTYRRSFQVDDVPGGAVMYNFAPHAAIIEEGRRPGARMPPVEAIFSWVVRKKIGRTINGPVQAFSGPRQKKGNRSDRKQAVMNNQRWIAWQIARAIKARGLKAKKILARAEQRLTPLVSADISRALGKDLSASS